MSQAARFQMVARPHPHFTIVEQCKLLEVPRLTLYYRPEPVSDQDLALMRRIDEIYTKWPFYGARRMVAELRGEGHEVNRKRIRRLMRLMGIEAIYQKPNTSCKHPAHAVYPYLLRSLAIECPNQVWCADITYIPMAKGWVYLVAIMDWYSRRVLAWRVSITMETDFCVEALAEALARFGKPAIFNTDQGSQFTAAPWIETLSAPGIQISMDGRSRFLDNIFIERLWRSLKYEEVFIHAYASVAEARTGIGTWLKFYNDERKHQALDYRTPREIFEADPTCGYVDNAKKGVAHIPTGSTTTERKDFNDERKVIEAKNNLLAA